MYRPIWTCESMCIKVTIVSPVFKSPMPNDLFIVNCLGNDNCDPVSIAKLLPPIWLKQNFEQLIPNSLILYAIFALNGFLLWFYFPPENISVKRNSNSYEKIVVMDWDVFMHRQDDERLGLSDKTKNRKAKIRMAAFISWIVYR